MALEDDRRENISLRREFSTDDLKVRRHQRTVFLRRPWKRQRAGNVNSAEKARAELFFLIIAMIFKVVAVRFEMKTLSFPFFDQASP